MADSSDGAPRAERAPVLLFDGLCNLCDASVRWMLAHDKRATFRFASLQSAAARRVLVSVGEASLAESDTLGTVVLVEGARVWTRSDAALELLARLGFPWSVAGVFRLVPRPLRDAVYDAIARRRTAWFGRRDSCARPEPGVRERFLDANEPLGPERPGTR